MLLRGLSKIVVNEKGLLERRVCIRQSNLGVTCRCGRVQQRFLAPPNHSSQRRRHVISMQKQYGTHADRQGPCSGQDAGESAQVRGRQSAKQDAE